MPVPFDTVEIKNCQIFIIKLERIEIAPVLNCLHQIFICNDFSVGCIYIHRNFLLRNIFYDIIQ